MLEYSSSAKLLETWGHHVSQYCGISTGIHGAIDSGHLPNTIRTHLHSISHSHLCAPYHTPTSVLHITLPPLLHIPLPPLCSISHSHRCAPYPTPTAVLHIPLPPLCSIPHSHLCASWAGLCIHCGTPGHVHTKHAGPMGCIYRGGCRGFMPFRSIKMKPKSLPFH